jgi:hypothetical protein
MPSADPQVFGNMSSIGVQPTPWSSSPAGISSIVEESSILTSGDLFAASTLRLATKLHSSNVMFIQQGSN